MHDWSLLAVDKVIVQPDTGNTAWVLVSAALIIFMTVGVAFFYGGMVRSKTVLNMLMMSFTSISIVTIVWALYGFSLSFGADNHGLIGSLTDFWGLKGLITQDATSTSGIPLVGSVPTAAFVFFQLAFAIITLALISGAVADRMKFTTWAVFSVLWITFVYAPVAHWVFDANNLVSKGGGWIVDKLHVVDFAGGTAIHINAGVAGLVLAIILGKRKGFGHAIFRPHNLPFTMLGSGILWFGWFGFNAGSALTANGAAASVAITTIVATAASMLAWLGVEKIRDGHATSLGGASGIVAGLVAITPSCAAVNVFGALVIGIVAGAICPLTIGLKYKLGFDDSLDVVGVHLVGGIIGTVLIGLVAAPNTASVTGDVKPGLFYGGGFTQLGRQTLSVIAVIVYCAIVTAIIAYILKVTMGLRISKEDEALGIDEAEHAENAYDYSGGLMHNSSASKFDHKLLKN